MPMNDPVTKEDLHNMVAELQAKNASLYAELEKKDMACKSLRHMLETLLEAIRSV